MSAYYLYHEYHHNAEIHSVKFSLRITKYIAYHIKNIERHHKSESIKGGIETNLVQRDSISNLGPISEPIAWQ